MTELISSVESLSNDESASFTRCNVLRTYPKHEKFQLSLKKGSVPLGLKLHETRCKQGVYVNGFTPKVSNSKSSMGLNSPPSSAATQILSIAAGDIIKEIDGQDVSKESLSTVKNVIEKSRRRDRLKTLISSARYIDLGKIKTEDSEFTILFERLSCVYTLHEVLLDPRKVPFFISSLREQGSREKSPIDKSSFYTFESSNSDHSGILNCDESVAISMPSSPFSSNTSPAGDSWSSTRMCMVRFLMDAEVLCEVVTLCKAKGSKPYLGTILLQYFHPGSKYNLCNIFHEIEPSTPGAVAAAAEISMSCTDDILASWSNITPLIQAAEVELCKEAFNSFQSSAWYSRMLSNLDGSASYLHVPLKSILSERTLRDVFMLYLLQLEEGEHYWLSAWQEIELTVTSCLARLNSFVEIKEESSEKIFLEKLRLMTSLIHLWEFYISPESHFSLNFPANSTIESAMHTFSMLSRPDLDFMDLSMQEMILLGQEMQSLQPAILLHIATDLLPRFRKSLVGEFIGAELLPMGTHLGSTVPVDAFEELWKIADQESFYCSLSKFIPLSPHVSRHRPPFATVNMNGHERNVSCANVSREFSEYKHLLKIAAIKRRFRFKNQLCTPATSSYSESLPDWILTFDGSVDSTNIISCHIVSYESITQHARDTSFPSGVMPFICPDLSSAPCEGSCFSKTQCSPRLFTFTTPGLDGVHTLFGACLLFYRPFNTEKDKCTSEMECNDESIDGNKGVNPYFLPCGLCVLSEKPILPILRRGLENWFNSIKYDGYTGELISTISLRDSILPNFEQNVSPYGGNITDADMNVLFRCLHSRQICLVIMTLLCEGQVVLISKYASLLTIAAETFRMIMEPLVWCHVFVPLLPRIMAPDLLQCPTPYLVGVLKGYLKDLEIPKEAVRVDLDEGCLSGMDHIPSLKPFSRVYAALQNAIVSDIQFLDDPSRGKVGTSEVKADAIFEIVQNSIDSILAGCWECCCVVGKGQHRVALFDQRMFKRLKASQTQDFEEIEEHCEDDVRQEENRSFYIYDEKFQSSFVETQMFSNFLSSVSEMQPCLDEAP